MDCYSTTSNTKLVLDQTFLMGNNKVVWKKHFPLFLVCILSFRINMVIELVSENLNAKIRSCICQICVLLGNNKGPNLPKKSPGLHSKFLGLEIRKALCLKLSHETWYNIWLDLYDSTVFFYSNFQLKMNSSHMAIRRRYWYCQYLVIYRNCDILEWYNVFAAFLEWYNIFATFDIGNLVLKCTAAIVHGVQHL